MAAEIFRVLKPGARFSCSEYLLTPDFNHADAHHVALHKLFLPTLAATQSNYPADVVTALERAGCAARFTELGLSFNHTHGACLLVLQLT